MTEKFHKQVKQEHKDLKESIDKEAKKVGTAFGDRETYTDYESINETMRDTLAAHAYSVIEKMDDHFIRTGKRSAELGHLYSDLIRILDNLLEYKDKKPKNRDLESEDVRYVSLHLPHLPLTTRSSRTATKNYERYVKKDQYQKLKALSVSLRDSLPKARIDSNYDTTEFPIIFVLQPKHKDKMTKHPLFFTSLYYKNKPYLIMDTRDKGGSIIEISNTGEAINKMKKFISEYYK